MLTLPKVMLVGGPDVDARLELMHSLQESFAVSAVGSERSLQDRFAKQGFDYHFYRLSRRLNPSMDMHGFYQLVQIFRQIKPQIVHTFATKPSIWGRLAARMANVPIVIGTLPGLGALYANNSIATRSLRLAYQPLQKLACHAADLTIFQNHDDAQQFVAERMVPENKTSIILGSGVATDVFKPSSVSHREKSQLRKELNIQQHEIVVTMISRVKRSKGVMTFVAAAQEVQRCYPQVRFLLVGPEDKEIGTLNAAEMRQLKQTVIWPGARRDIPAVLSISDLFVLPSAYREGIPRVLLEAAAMELPLITANAPGCNEVVADGVNGFLVPSGNSAALSQAILRQIEQPELRFQFGQASRQRAVTRFDLKIIAEQTRLMYRQLLMQSSAKLEFSF